ncbi:MAG: VWA domain-containing protein [Myxococcales bacterium]|nr:VWA domain-containing protein [Myxococcales bacterium]
MTVRSMFLGSFAAVMMIACGGGSGGDDDDQDASTLDAANCVSDGCAPELVCNPSNGACEPIACSMHTDCPMGTYCGPAGVCTPSNTGGPCANDDSCTNGETCIGGFCACAGQQFAAEGVPPNVLIVLDRSGSMGTAIGGVSKWQIAVTAIQNLLASHGNQVRFGLDLYEPPAGGSCAAGAIVVGVGPTDATAISNALAGTGPGGLTPIGSTLAALATYPGLHDPARENYVLLLTDGEETCSGDGIGAATALRNGTPEIKTFVVGFGSGVDATFLDAVATAGGTARVGGPPYYYQADDAMSLNDAFDAIGSAVLSCTYTLSGAPDLDTMFIRFDGVDILRDQTHVNGWDYDSATNQLTFYGAACAALRGGDVTDLVVGSGCSVG